MDRFLERDFFDENDTASLVLPDRALSLEAVAVCRADACDTDMYDTPFDPEDMDRLVARAHETAVFERAGAYGEGDQLIGLSTCYSTGADVRTMLICKVTGEFVGLGVSRASAPWQPAVCEGPAGRVPCRLPMDACIYSSERIRRQENRR